MDAEWPSIISITKSEVLGHIPEEGKNVTLGLRVGVMSGPIPLGPSAHRRGIEILEMIISPKESRGWGGVRNGSRMRSWATPTFQGSQIK